MDKFTNYSADIQEYYRRFTAGGFGESRLTFYDDEEISNLPEEVKNSSLACGNPLQYLKSAKIPDNAKILDLGCGGGFELVRLLNEINPQLAVGLDYSPQMIARCHTNLLNHTSTSGACMQGNGEFLPFKNASFDFVISNAAINLIPDKEKTFKEIRRVLKPDGRLFFSDVTIHVELPDKVR
jgi:SAM-dependent methyltransferase